MVSQVLESGMRYVCQHFVAIVYISLMEHSGAQVVGLRAVLPIQSYFLWELRIWIATRSMQVLKNATAPSCAISQLLLVEGDVGWCPQHAMWLEFAAFDPPCRCSKR